MDPGLITTALTAAGAPVWAAAIQMIIQVLKAVPQFKRLLEGFEKLVCFLLALVVTLLAAVAAISVSPPQLSFDIFGIVTTVLAWFTVARLAMAFFDDFIANDDGDKPTESVLNSKGWTG
jgi:hypothetical protein